MTLVLLVKFLQVEVGITWEIVTSQNKYPRPTQAKNPLAQSVILYTLIKTEVGRLN